MTGLRVLAKPRFGINPRNAQLYSYLELDHEVEEVSIKSIIKNYDILHIHWPDRVFKWRLPTLMSLGVLFAFLGFFKIRRTKVIYTCHNPFPRLPRGGQKNYLALYYKILNILVDGLVILSEGQKETVRTLFPSVKLVKVIPLGIQDVDDVAPVLSEQKMHPPTPFVFVAGMQERTKKTELVLSELQEHLSPDYRIFVCGIFPDPEYFAQLRKEFSEHRFHFANMRLSDSEYNFVIRQAAAVVIAQHNPTNSGVATLSVALGTPCYTNSESFVAEFGRQYGGGYIHSIASMATGVANISKNSGWLKYRMRDVAVETASFYKIVCGVKN